MSCGTGTLSRTVLDCPALSDTFALTVPSGTGEPVTSGGGVAVRATGTLPLIGELPPLVSVNETRAFLPRTSDAGVAAGTPARSTNGAAMFTVLNETLA